MKKEYVLVLTIIFINFFLINSTGDNDSSVNLSKTYNFFQAQKADAFAPWGVVADDGSAIQPFITSKTLNRDYRIPQDEDTLDIDYFYVYLEWRGASTNREFILQLYERKEREIIVSGETTKEDYWDLYAETIVLMIKGGNEWNDPRFALKKIDNSVLSDFKKSERKEKIVILYRDLELTFYHKTSWAEIEQTKTLMQWNIEALILAIWTIFIGFVAGGASKVILNKATYVPDLPHWSIWILLFLLIFVAALVFFLISGYNLDEIFRVIILVPAPLVSVCFGLYFAFWLAAKFRPEKLREFLFIILDLPTLEDVRTGKRRLKDEHELPVDAITVDGFVNKKGEIELVDDPNSYWETIRRMKMGGIKFNMKKLGRRIRVKQKWKTFDDIIFCDDFQKQELEVGIRSGALYSLSSVLILIGIFCWVVPVIMGIAGITTGILGAIFLTIGLLFFVWENLDITAPIINVSPITNREAIMIIRDKLTLDMKDEEIADLELDLFKEKANLAKKTRAQTMKALEEIEDATMPLKELAEGEFDIEDLPEPIKKIVKSWTEKWEKEGIGEMKEIVSEPETEEKGE